ncbi:hypothetical protein [Naasia sp. SYSU D00057]|uniref:hypothetical protein n=1 Tax=Naasia sp. SYSU D00057 TaxID=2817380 RepID=UPI001B310CA9|nr:hypothetical protein [Naasia sp. SYSU D00057]
METLPTLPAAPVDRPEVLPPSYPRSVSGGWWPTSHVQGIAVDRLRGHLYFSFTTALVKTDLHGNLLATVEGLSGHLGDVTFDPATRKVYGSLEYKAAEAFYVAVFDAEAIHRVGLEATDPRVMRTVHLAEVTADFVAPPSVAQADDTARGRYGCSGFDGIAMGPRFGSSDGRRLLTIAYGVYSGPDRDDNDHQVLLQYAADDWWDTLARPLVEAAPHRSGPARPDGKYFVRTGNTTFGVQNLEYDEELRRWFLGVYPGRKPAFPNFTLFSLDADARPRRQALAGLAGERGRQLPLSADGLADRSTGIRGWYQRADVGIAALGGGLFYLSTADAVGGLQTSRLTLCRWTGDPVRPFVPVEEERRIPGAADRGLAAV